jgi:hypothetical protein
MNSPKESTRLGGPGRWSRELWLSGIALVTGFVLLPGLIFFTGAAALGRYEDATPLRLYQTVYGGLAKGSVASWVVLFGPYGLYLLFKGLIACWRAGIKSPMV